MARMVELIREGKAPESIVRRAARGELALPAAEAIEILALLAEDDVLGDDAEQTLRGWDEAAVAAVAADPQTLPAVLRCLLWTQEERPAIIEALCENRALSLDAIEDVASQVGPAALEAMKRSERVRSSRILLEPAGQDTAAVPHIEPEPGAGAEAGEVCEQLPTAHEGGQDAAAADLHHDEFYPHAAELKDEEDRPFELVTDEESQADPLVELLQRAKKGEPAAKPEEKDKLSLLQRLVHMRVGDRIKLAMRGGREERMVLIRDRSRLVSLAVLASPKVDSSEMESYAAMKNVQESVLRAIAANRKNLKNYGVVRTLASNPKTPLDVSLPLMAHLLVKDLRLLAMNKNVNETIRKRANRMFKVKTEEKKG
jgi:hypothetical protein